MGRRLLRIWRILRFRVWALRTDLSLRRFGGRLVIDAPHPVSFHELPLIEPSPDGGSGGTLTLRVAPGVHLGRRLTIEVWARGDSSLELGEGTRFWSEARIQLRNGQVSLGRDVQVRDRVQLKSDGRLNVGDHVVIGRDSLLHCTERIDVASHVGMGERTSIIDSDHSPDGGDRHYLDQPLRVSPVHLGSNVLVSANVVILRGSRIGANALIGAGAVLTGGEYRGGWLIAGMPAREVEPLTTAPPTP